jgi:hypothetical protein
VRRCSSRTRGPCGSVPSIRRSGGPISSTSSCSPERATYDHASSIAHGFMRMILLPTTRSTAPLSQPTPRMQATQRPAPRTRGRAGAIARGRGRHLSPGYDIVVASSVPAGRRKPGAQVRSFCCVSSVDHEVGLPADDRENGSLKCTLSRAFQRIWTDGHGHDHGSDLQRCLLRIWPDIVRPLF